MKACPRGKEAMLPRSNAVCNERRRDGLVNNQSDAGKKCRDESGESDVIKSMFKSNSKFSSGSDSDDSLTTIDFLARENENNETMFKDDEDDDPLLFPINNDDKGGDGEEMGPLLSVDGTLLMKEQEVEVSKDGVSTEEKNFDPQAYLDKRVMTPLQERFNAITILPNMIYCFYFVLAGCWLTSEHIEKARQSLVDEREIETSADQESGWTDVARGVFGEENGWMGNIGCINVTMLPNLYALPPLPVVAGAIGIIAHAPFSFLYHWAYATKLHPSKRVDHWSRRLDHAFIHFASACMAYATSGRIDYFLLNAAFNLDCAYRQFERRVRPRRNQARIMISIILYTLPVLRRGFFWAYLQLCVLFGLSGWFFIAYPVGGWSHSLFHVVISFCPHIIMVSACKLQSSQLQISLAAKCAVMAGKA